MSCRSLLLSAVSLGVATFSFSPCAASPLAFGPGAMAPEQFGVLSHVRRASPFDTGRFVRSSQPQPAASSRRRSLGLAACTPFTVTFPSNVGSPVNSPVTLTAAEIDPATVKGPVDAGGCDVGIYLDSKSSLARIFDAQIYDANQFGILAVGAKSALILNTTIFRIGNHDGVTGSFDPNGDQTGVGIDFEGATGSIAGAFISQYQKNGVAFHTASSVSIVNSSVIGLGTVDFIAQNGVEFYQAAVRGISNVVAASNHFNLPGSPWDGGATGFLLLCTNLKPAYETTLLNYSFSFDNDQNYISNDTTDGDCPVGYKT